MSKTILIGIIFSFLALQALGAGVTWHMPADAYSSACERIDRQRWLDDNEKMLESAREAENSRDHLRAALLYRKVAKSGYFAIGNYEKSLQCYERFIENFSATSENGHLIMLNAYLEAAAVEIRLNEIYRRTKTPPLLRDGIGYFETLGLSEHHDYVDTCFVVGKLYAALAKHGVMPLNERQTHIKRAHDIFKAVKDRLTIERRHVVDEQIGRLRTWEISTNLTALPTQELSDKSCNIM